MLPQALNPRSQGPKEILPAGCWYTSAPLLQPVNLQRHPSDPPGGWSLLPRPGQLGLAPLTSTPAPATADPPGEPRMSGPHP